MRNKAFSETKLIDAAIAFVRAVLPPTWTVKTEREPRARTGSRRAGRPDLVVRLRAPDGNEQILLVEVKTRVDARDVPSILDRVRGSESGVPFLTAPYLGPRARVLLEERGIGYLDMTGNARLALDRPAVLIQKEGASRNPVSEAQPIRSLKGTGSARVVRALCEFRPPVGIRELAKRSGSSPASVVRVVELLDREAILVRAPRGPVERVEWNALLRRWAQDYDTLKSNRTGSFLEPRGLPALTRKLRDSGSRHAITASLAAAEIAPIAPPKLARVFVDSIERIAGALELQPAATAGNVILAEPYDDVVFERTWQRNGLVFAALPQVAADLLTGPGREPSEAEALLKWMEGNERAWRT